MTVLPLTGCSVDLDRGVVRTDAGEERDLTALETGLIRYLAERPGTDVGRDELVREVWRGARPDRVVDVAVRRLRAKLGEPRRPVHLLTAHGHGYRFVPLVAETRRVEMEEVVVPLRDGELHLGQRRFVRDGRSVALSRIEGLVLDELVACLGRPVERAPLIARVWGRGRHDHTLDATVARLRRKLERDPASPAVLVTVKGIGPRLVGVTRGDPAPAGSSFVDRPEHAEAVAALRQHRLVTLLGTAGIGKTRLAREVAAGWPGEAWFCELGRVTGADALVARMAATLGRDGDAAQVGSLLAARPAGTLFVLDNLEQLTDCADIVGRWVGSAERARFLTTSRVALGLAEEHRVALEPLEAGAAVRLFEERGGSGAPDEVRDLMERLDRLPLAIELAAAVSGRPNPSRVERTRLDLLVLRPPGAESQHSTLRGAIDWSWHLLDPEQQEVLAALAVFASPFDADAVGAVVGRDARAVLEALVARSLVRRIGERWTMFASIQEYARERLLLAGRSRPTFERHAEHFAALAEPLRADLGGPWGAEALRQLNELRDELLTALEQTEDRDLRGRIARVLAARGFHASRQAMHDLLSRAMSRGVEPHHELELWLAMAACSWNQGLTERAAEEIARAEPHDPDGLAVTEARARLALLALRPAEAEGWCDELRQRLLALPPSPERLRRLAEIAALRVPALALLLRIDDWERAVHEGLALGREVGDAALVGLGLRSAARLALQVGRRDEARAYLDEAISVARRALREDDELAALIAKAITDYHRGAFAAAEDGLGAYEDGARAIGLPADDAAFVRCWMAFERGDVAAASVLPVVSKPALISWSSTARALLLQWSGRAAEAIPLLEQVCVAHAPSRVELAGACAQAGRHAEAVGWLAQGKRLDPRLDGLARQIALTEALIALERVRGTAGWDGARARARAVLADGERTPCDDGVARERPGAVANARILLERALDRGHSPG